MTFCRFGICWGWTGSGRKGVITVVRLGGGRVEATGEISRCAVEISKKTDHIYREIAHKVAFEIDLCRTGGLEAYFSGFIGRYRMS
jgi:hypothetical protein